MELVVVLAIAAVLVAVAGFSIPGFRFDRNQVAADTLAAHLRYARTMAVNRERTVKISVSASPLNRYDISIADTNGVFTPAKDPVTQTDWGVSISTNYPGVLLSNTTTICFSRTNGIPCDISGVPLTATTTVTFASGRTVTISPQTGFVRVQ